MVTTSPSASASPSSPKCLRETGRGVVLVVGRLPIPTTPCSLPGTPLTVRTEQLLPSKAHVRAPHLGKGLGEGRPGWGPPTVRVPAWGSPYQHAAAQDLHRQQQRQLPWGRALWLQHTRAGSVWLSAPHVPPSPGPLTCVTV